MEQEEEEGPQREEKEEEEEEEGRVVVPWGPQMTRGPPPVASVALHHQTTISHQQQCIHDRAITTIGDSLSPSAITVHSSVLTKLWESSHQSEFSNRHKITITGHRAAIKPAIATICNSLSSPLP